MQEEFFITRLTAIFFSYLVGALLVERIVEIAVAVLKYFELKFKRPNWNLIAEEMRIRFERLYELQSIEPKAHKALDMLLWNLITVVSESGKRVVMTDLIRLRFYRMTSLLITFLSALFLTFMINYDFISIVVKAYPDILKLFDPRPYQGLNILLTAFALSFGVQPLHQFISRLEKRLESKTQTGGAQ
ncbi:MAG: hypothetical protein EHM72_17830 [Calditrichaeota bacterium]|nr:MAG: hypothetical protein EHM72_17830 [Calditrichota bacterium]